MRAAVLHFTLLPNASDIKVVAALLPIDLEKRKKNQTKKLRHTHTREYIQHITTATNLPSAIDYQNQHLLCLNPFSWLDMPQALPATK